jgi:hypothetical protein
VSSALGLAAVTAVLKDLLNNGFVAHDLSSALGTINVSALAPDLVPTGRDEPSRLNLFLYQVTPNPGWRNLGLPSRDGSGALVSDPPLALDLHYLLTAYASRDFQAEILLGYALQLLHETPVLARDAIRTALQAPSPVDGSILPPAQQALSAADLADQVEQIKMTPEPLSTEELSRLWAAFQVHYRPTAAFLASVVLIDGKRSTRTAPPVRTRTIRVMPLRQPVIERILSFGALDPDPQADRPVVAGDTLLLTGRNLLGDVTLVRVGGLSITPAGGSDTRLPVPLTTPPFAAGTLRAGVQGVQVVHQLVLGTPADPHAGFASNVAAIVLRPTISVLAVTATSVTLRFDPPVGRAQRVLLVLHQTAAGGSAYSVIGPERPADTDTIVFDLTRADAQGNPVPVVPAGVYTVRAQVDGAESPLEIDPVTRHYTGAPSLIVP